MSNLGAKLGKSRIENELKTLSQKLPSGFKIDLPNAVAAVMDAEEGSSIFNVVWPSIFITRGAGDLSIRHGLRMNMLIFEEKWDLIKIANEIAPRLGLVAIADLGSRDSWESLNGRIAFNNETARATSHDPKKLAKASLEMSENMDAQTRASAKSSLKDSDIRIISDAIREQVRQAGYEAEIDEERFMAAARKYNSVNALLGSADIGFIKIAGQSASDILSNVAGTEANIVNALDVALNIIDASSKTLGMERYMF